LYIDDPTFGPPSTLSQIFYVLLVLFVGIGIIPILVWITEEGSNKSAPKKPVQKKKLKCRVCKTNLPYKSVGERIVRGTAVGSAGTGTGAIIGTILLPGIGTVIGAGMGAWGGTITGSMQNNDICSNCCGSCESKKGNCICNLIIGLCRQCGDNITLSNSSDGYCYTCSNSWYSGDI